MYEEGLHNLALISTGEGMMDGIGDGGGREELVGNDSSSQGRNQKVSDERSFKAKTGVVCATHHPALLR